MSTKKGKEVIRIEAEAIQGLMDRIDESFQQAVDIMLKCKGRIIVTGMGKSGIIGRKIASTLNSTGTSAIFLHPAEGVHGDLGVVLKEDVVICISKSGNTEEILRLIPIFKRQGCAVITLTGCTNSTLGKQSNVVLDISVKEEACPYDLVPTASSTAALVMGDALALALFQERGLGVEDYAQLHPAGDIGKRFFLRVDEIMRTKDDIAKVDEDTLLSKTILEMSSKRLGATCVMDGDGKLVGIVTDGDLRRLIEKSHDIWNLQAKDIMCRYPKCVRSGVLAVEALRTMEEFSINQLIVTDENDNPVGMVHIHDLIKAGLA
jgi:arabinose-5-phosphate isomerase